MYRCLEGYFRWRQIINRKFNKFYNPPINLRGFFYAVCRDSLPYFSYLNSFCDIRARNTLSPVFFYQNRLVLGSNFNACECGVGKVFDKTQQIFAGCF